MTEEKVREIIKEIHDYCENQCGFRGACMEDDCVLFRIEKLTIGEEYY